MKSQAGDLDVYNGSTILKPLVDMVYGVAESSEASKSINTLNYREYLLGIRASDWNSIPAGSLFRWGTLLMGVTFRAFSEIYKEQGLALLASRFGLVGTALIGISNGFFL